MKSRASSSSRGRDASGTACHSATSRSIARSHSSGNGSARIRARFRFRHHRSIDQSSGTHATRNGTEAAILTDRRVLYHRGGTTTGIALEDIVDVDHRQESIIGDIIEVVAEDGTALRIESRVGARR